MAAAERPRDGSEGSVRFSEEPSTPSSRASTEADAASGGSNSNGGSGSYRGSMGTRDSTDRRPRMGRSGTLHRISSAFIGSSRSSMEDHDDIIREIIIQFNMKAKNGVKMLVQNKKVAPNGTAREVAAFLFHTEGLSKRRIGEFV
eukprot:CAMPEP_0119500294 /NCGR_PEP_ID=MMETSP1344-20130328/22474_1 /TAXON_ID=236787 /ORGANISM="Florenciella parvula, Strain CCMP2471" /LENGTH=144 /DNA_ID=CAMNT_0007536363 /DNA_START=372 /DNA_END=803 /DNA_ORIENTATION=+